MIERGGRGRRRGEGVHDRRRLVAREEAGAGAGAAAGGRLLRVYAQGRLRPRPQGEPGRLLLGEDRRAERRLWRARRPRAGPWPRGRAGRGRRVQGVCDAPEDARADEAARRTQAARGRDGGAPVQRRPAQARRGDAAVPPRHRPHMRGAREAQARIDACDIST